MPLERQLPRYKCHKEVWALKIAAINYDPQPENSAGPVAATITPADGGYAPFRVDAEYVFKHNPQAGGYYVVYEGGYASWSPAEAFEGGYTRMAEMGEGCAEDDEGRPGCDEGADDDGLHQEVHLRMHCLGLAHNPDRTVAENVERAKAYADFALNGSIEPETFAGQAIGGTA